MFPKFVDLWVAYGEMLAKEGKNPCNGPWKNQCSIRMSITLIKCGLSFKGYTEPKCSHGHARGAESLANWLWGKHLRAPKQFTDGAKAKEYAKDQTGIIFFKDCFTRSGESSADGDHIDLWNKGSTQTYDDPSNVSKQVWFWQLLA
jgi:hypothetical protein